ncbi:hypothetical protein INT45_008199, partial [Circinella minor]
TGFEFNDNEITKLKSVFDTMAEGQNTLAVATLRSILNKAHTTLDQQLDERLSKIKDPMRFDDFLQIIEQQRMQNPEEGLKRVFTMLDKDNKGLINGEDLRQGLLNFGETVTEDDIQRMLRSADVDGDGMINYEEFVKILTPSRVNGQK